MTKFIKALLTIMPLSMISSCSNNNNSNSETLNEELPKLECVAIDLGLPSGTVWAESNLGATSCEQQGDYFCWGEVKAAVPNVRYKYVNDCYYDGGGKAMYLKYVTDEEYGKVDNLLQLDASDDAAVCLVGDGWQIPTIEDIDELFQYCTQKAEVRNNQEGVSFIGPNGNSIFLPNIKVPLWIEGVFMSDPIFDPIYWSKNLASSPEWKDLLWVLSNDQFACGININNIADRKGNTEAKAEKDAQYRTNLGYIRAVRHK